MSSQYFLGFDCGTYESKGVICDVNGVVKASASEKHLLLMPQLGFAEHDPLGEWWRDFIVITQRMLNESCIEASDIAGVGISTVMAGIVPVDNNVNPLRNAILYGIDTRCVEQAEKLNRLLGEDRVRAISGAKCTTESFGPKILWIRENEPEVFAKTKHITMASGFLTAKLTGNFAVDKYSAMGAQPLIDAHTVTWHTELCESVCPQSMLPRIHNTTDVIGKVTRAAAAETGLAEGTPVICGTTDGGAEAASVGVVKPGDTMIMYGSTAFVNRLSDHPVKGTSIWSGPYLFDNVYANTAGMATTGSLTRWIRDNFAKDLLERESTGGRNAYDALFAEAEGIRPGSDGLLVLPYFLGERMPIQDPAAKGVIFGLGLRHKRGHIMHAALEGVGYGLSQILELLDHAVLPVKEAVAVGGGARNRQWVQIVSDICLIRQVIPRVTIGAAFGDALLAALGVGAIESPEEIKRINQVQSAFEPNHDNKIIYEKNRKLYKELYECTKDIMHQL